MKFIIVTFLFAAIVAVYAAPADPISGLLGGLLGGGGGGSNDLLGGVTGLLGGATQDVSVLLNGLGDSVGSLSATLSGTQNQPQP